MENRRNIILFGVPIGLFVGILIYAVCLNDRISKLEETQYGFEQIFAVANEQNETGLKILDMVESSKLTKKIFQAICTIQNKRLNAIERRLGSDRLIPDATGILIMPEEND